MRCIKGYDRSDHYRSHHRGHLDEKNKIDRSCLTRDFSWPLLIWRELMSSYKLKEKRVLKDPKPMKTPLKGETDPNIIASTMTIVMTWKTIVIWRSKSRSSFIGGISGDSSRDHENLHLDLMAWWRGRLTLLLGGSTSGGDNTSCHKFYTRTTIKKHTILEDNSKITFKDEETEYLNPNYNDILVVFVRMINTRVKRVMIEIGSFTNMLYFNVFQKLKLLTNDFTPITSLLIWFTSNSISPLGTMSLYIIFDNELYSKMVMTKFIVVDISLAYNIVISWPTRLRDVV